MSAIEQLDKRNLLAHRSKLNDFWGEKSLLKRVTENIIHIENTFGFSLVQLFPVQETSKLTKNRYINKWKLKNRANIKKKNQLRDLKFRLMDHDN